MAKDKVEYRMNPHNFELVNTSGESKHANYHGWETINPSMSDTYVSSINDPNLDNTSDEITSIPSPFARIDIMEKAFEEVNRLGIAGQTKYHKMVSFWLDIAQMFYSYHSLSGKLEIIKWDKNADLQKLQNGSEGNKKFARTLELFLRQDAYVYNFNQMSSIYLLRYKDVNQVNSYKIIGATSPITLFFTSANKYNIDISFEDKYGKSHKVLDDKELLPLLDRSEEFRKYIYTLQGGFAGFKTYFKAVSDYIETCKNNDNMPLGNYAGDYSPINVGVNTVQILGEDLPGYKIQPTGQASDFIIKPTQTVLGNLPMVFPCENAERYRKYIYLGNNWGQRLMPEGESNTIADRRLPDRDEVYPYLLKNDFLSETLYYLIREEKFDETRFYDGNLTYAGNRRRKYLLPIKPSYFSYFTKDDFSEKFSMKEVKLSDGSISIEAKLEIPVKGGSVIYHRTYSSANIKCLNINIAIVSPIEQVDKTVVFNNKAKNDIAIKLSFYKGSESLITNPNYNRNKNYGIYNVGDFDCITLEIDNTLDVAMLLPKFKKISGNNVFHFSIDLGTTNTQIAYGHGIGALNEEIMSAKDTDSLIWTMRDGTSAEEKNDIYDYIFPACITNNDISDIYSVKFPIRTALLSRKEFNWNIADAKLFEDVTIPFFYGQHSTEGWNDNLDVNLKWANANDPTEQGKMRAFIELLMRMIRDKVVMLNGDTKQTKITWHYPLSMDNIRRNHLSKCYEDLYKKYFGDNIKNVVSKSESQSPVDFFQKNTNVNRPNLVTIDIGGGTTDIALVDDNNTIKYVTSFKFAANSLFKNNNGAFAGNGSSPILDIFYTNDIKKKLDVILIKSPFLQQSKNQIERRRNTTELATFLLSLPERPEIRNARATYIVDLLGQIQQDSRFTLIFAVFYGAIVYHIAKIMKLKNLPRPRFISLSGNGSKILKIFDTKSLGNFSKYIFNKVYGDNDDNDINVLTTGNPKDVTVLGGLLQLPIQNLRDKQIIYITDKIVADKNNTPIYDDISDSDTNKDAVIKDVNQFWEDIFAVFTDNWKGITSDLGIANGLQMDFLNNIKKDLKQKTESNISFPKGQDAIENTFFFESIEVALYEMTEQISNWIKNKK